MSDEIVELRKDIIALKKENAKLKEENETLRIAAEKSKFMQQNRAVSIIAKKPMEKRFFKNWLLFDTLPWINRKELANSSLSTASETFRQLSWPKLHQNVKSHEIRWLKFFPARYELGNLRPLVHIISDEIVPIASIPPPEYITGFKQIHLDFVDDQIVDFFKSIANLLENCEMRFYIFNKMDKKRHASTHALLQCLIDKIFEINYNSHFNEFDRLFPGIYVHVQYIWFWWKARAHDDIDFILNWLAKPSKSGKQKIMFISGIEPAEMITFINRVKEEFSNSNSTSIFLIDFWAEHFDEFVVKNTRTNEILALYRGNRTMLGWEGEIEYLYYLARYPKGEEHWKEVVVNKKIDQISDSNSTVIQINI